MTRHKAPVQSHDVPVTGRTVDVHGTFVAGMQRSGLVRQHKEPVTRGRAPLPRAGERPPGGENALTSACATQTCGSTPVFRVASPVHRVSARVHCVASPVLLVASRVPRVAVRGLCVAGAGLCCAAPVPRVAALVLSAASPVSRVAVGELRAAGAGRRRRAPVTARWLGLDSIRRPCPPPPTTPSSSAKPARGS